MLSRRQLLVTLGGFLPAVKVSLMGMTALPEEAPAKTQMGVGEHSYGMRNGRREPGGTPFNDAIQFLDYCRSLGAGGIQIGIGTRDADYAARLRKKAEEYAMFLEGSVRLPRDRADLDRFESDVRTARAAGASVLRSVMLGGRRYETFETAESFLQFAEQSWNSLVLAEPVLARHGARLAIENHKDWRAPELIAMLRRISSQHVGVCVDTGNSIALLEDPNETVEALAPWAFATHIKDMGVREYEEGFLLSEVPLGQGFLDLKKICQTLRKANPEIRFSLEMITRDPLRIPCLTRKYWATFESLPGRHLADALAMVRRHASRDPLPQMTGLSEEARLKAEDTNVRRCLAYARDQLAL